MVSKILVNTKNIHHIFLQLHPPLPVIKEKCKECQHPSKLSYPINHPRFTFEEHQKKYRMASWYTFLTPEVHLFHDPKQQLMINCGLEPFFNYPGLLPLEKNICMAYKRRKRKKYTEQHLETMIKWTYNLQMLL